MTHYKKNGRNDYLEQKSRLPKKGISEMDMSKIALLKSHFIDNLRRYHYSSLSSFDGIEISEESLLPTIDGFDMKFDSSASDGISGMYIHRQCPPGRTRGIDHRHGGLGTSCNRP